MIQKMVIPKVIFKIPSYEKVAQEIFNHVQFLKEKYNRVIYLNLPENLVKEIIGKNFLEIKEKIIEEVKKKHDIKKLENYKMGLKKYWNPLNKLFFENLKEIMRFDFKYKEYVVYITEIIRGMYSTENVVFTNPNEEVKKSGYIIAEEILHLHYWDIYRKIVKDVKCPWRDNERVWEFSETIPEFVLTDNLFERFSWGKNLNRKYLFIEKRKKELLPVWKDKKSFKDFMIKIHKTK